MKWKQWILTGAFLILFIPTKAYAGNINGNEQSVLAVAGGTFEYKGVTYKATSQHLAEARAKMMQDDVDLTPEQAQEAIASIYANVKTGIDEGYIVPISGSANTTEKESDSESNNESKETSTEKGTSQSEDTSVNQNTQNSGTNQTTEGNHMTETNENSANSQTADVSQKTTNSQNTQISENTENGNSTNQTVQKEEIEEIKTPEQLKWEKEQLPKLKKQKKDVIADNFVKELEETTEQLQSTEELELASDENIIKDTNCNFSHIWLVPIIFFTGIGICVMSIIKYHLLAHNHES